MVDVFAGHTLVNKKGEAVDPEGALKNKVVGLYFSGGWCPPCCDFTPRLCQFYTELVEESVPAAQFEIVFVSSDKSQADMENYMAAMHGDWLALPWQNPYKTELALLYIQNEQTKQAKRELKKKYCITAIPKLIIVKQDGDVITDKGCKQIRDYGLACFRDWIEVADVFQNFSAD